MQFLQFFMPVQLYDDLKSLARARQMRLDDYIVEKLQAIVAMNKIKGPEEP